LWREFAAAKAALDRRRPNRYVTLVPPKEFPTSGIDIVIRDDAIFVGNSCVRGLLPYRGVSVHDARLELFLPSDEGENSRYLLPVAGSALANVTRVVERFIAADNEAARLREEEDARPTLPNRLGKWVNSHPAIRWMEHHFALVLLAFFFGLIPLCVFCLYCLSLIFHWNLPD
jgi:hypothetical protein